MSLSCPWCYRRVTLDDVIVKGELFAKGVQTCGRIVVMRRGVLVASQIEGRMGIEVHGRIDGEIRSGTVMLISATGRVRGSAVCPSIVIEPGGVVEGALLRIGHREVPLIARESGVRRVDPGVGFDAAAAKAQGEKLRVVLTLRDGRPAGHAIRSRR